MPAHALKGEKHMGNGFGAKEQNTNQERDYVRNSRHGGWEERENDETLAGTMNLFNMMVLSGCWG